MDDSPDLQRVPPAWSARFGEYFVGLKRWIDDSAYPALVRGPLQSEATVRGIPSEVSRLQEELARSRPIPIVLVGLTGVGKSTLLNALLEEEFLPVGVIGSQTAAFVTISYAPQWEVTCEYIDAGELAEIFQEAGSEVDETAESGSPEARDRAERKVRALLNLADDALLPSHEELRKGPSEELLDTVAPGKRRFSIGSDWKEHLNLHAKGRLWPVTKSIDVRGPFGMLKSGVVISDLPGAGDLNRARANQAAAAIKDAGQILIACDARLLQTSLMDQLEAAGRLPHRLFQANEWVQLVIVGTSLDKGLPDSEEDAGQVQELGLDPNTATPQDVFRAVCRKWEQKVKPVFGLWLRTKALEFLPDLGDAEREARAQKVLERVAVVPTSAKDWMRHSRGRKMQVCVAPPDTGIPALRDHVNALAQHQIDTTIGLLEQRITTLRDSVLDSIERSEAALGADIEGILAALDRSRHRMQEVQDGHEQAVNDLRLSVLERFQQIRETIGDKIQNAALKMRDVGRQQVQAHLDGIHWASLRATLSHDGFWITRNGRQVNLRDAMGGQMTRLVPQAWSRIADERIGKQIAESSTRLHATLGMFAKEIRDVVDDQVADPLSRRTVGQLFEASLARAKVNIEVSAKRVTDLLGSTSKDMQQRVDEAVDTSLSGVCGDCSEDSGIGWKGRSVARIIEGTSQVADKAEKKCLAITDEVFEALADAVKEYCQTAVEEMHTIGNNIPDVLQDAIGRARLTTPQAQRSDLVASRTCAPDPPSMVGAQADGGYMP
jgi:hypothetical protein